MLRFPKAFPDESYVITLPALHVEGIITGSPYVSSTAARRSPAAPATSARVTTRAAGGSRARRTRSGRRSRADAPKKALYTAEGQWTGAFSIADAAGRAVAGHDPAKTRAVAPEVRDVDAQGELESRRAWRAVAEAIRAGDMERTQREKSAIENRQRELRRREQEEGREWARQYFARAARDEAWERAAAALGGDEAAPDTAGGVWVWKGEAQADG